MVGVYQIRNNINGMRYIGQSIDIERRWQEERCRTNPQVNDHLRRAFNKYGFENFSFSVLCECAPDELTELECFLIAETESYIKTKGYNKTLGGEGGRWTVERRQKKAQRMTGENNHFYGKKHTVETRTRLSEQRRGEKHFNFGKKLPKITRERMSVSSYGGKNAMAKRTAQMTPEGAIVAVFESAADAARCLKISRSAIKNCASGRVRTSHGFRWQYINN